MSDRRKLTRRGAGRRTAAALLTAAALSATAAGPAQAGLVGGLLGTTTTILTGTVGVVSTTLDTTTGLLGGADWGYAPSVIRLPEVATSVKADALYQKGFNGKGVGVALIDSGVVPVKGLTSGNVVLGPDLSLDSQAPQGNLDGFGHGTHMAGIIAGNDGTKNGFRGIAPGATLLSVRAGAHEGSADVSQVIAAVDWVVQHRNDNGMNVRVLNLSYGTSGTQDPARDPLTHAIENAWRAGITVVVSGGNHGAAQTSLDNPARDPFVLTVGAADTHNTPDSVLDDTIPTFSSRGSVTRRVDVVAPGQSVASLRNPGSVIDTEYPNAVVDTRLFKGSGTSEATAVVSGAVALLLQQRPSLTPDDVKRLLMTTAQPIVSDVYGSGSGLINVSAASQAPRPLVTQVGTRSTGLGTLEGARGAAHIGDGGSNELSGEKDIFGKAWTPSVWAPKSSAGTAWSGGNWNGTAWAGTCWCTTSASWTSNSWSSGSWSSNSWSSGSWSSNSWSSNSWSSGSWSSGSWSSNSWSSNSWSSSSWSAASGV